MCSTTYIRLEHFWNTYWKNPMTKQTKTQIRIYLRDEALQKASDQAASTGKNISETIEQFIMEEADNAIQPTNR